MKKLKYPKRYYIKDVSVSHTTEHPNIFCETPSSLGEGPLWSKSRNSLFWVDILSNRLYEKSWQSDTLTIWDLPETVSSLAENESAADCLWLISEQYVVSFDLITGAYKPITEIPLDRGFRTNDGKVGPDGRYWFGSMLRTPQSGIGQIFSIGKDKIINTELNGIAIPNTFCWMPDGSVLISDSLQQICHRFLPGKDASEIKSIGNFIDISGTSGTPDGGALDKQGNIWIALWGASKVVCYSPAGEQLHEIALPVSQPSSCCFGGPDNNMLFITSAKEGLMTAQLQQYPDSGKVFVAKLMVQGAPVHKFSTE